MSARLGMKTAKPIMDEQAESNASGPPINDGIGVAAIKGMQRRAQIRPGSGPAQSSRSLFTKIVNLISYSTTTRWNQDGMIRDSNSLSSRSISYCHLCLYSPPNTYCGLERRTRSSYAMRGNDLM